jgi:hypothetical protein
MRHLRKFNESDKHDWDDIEDRWFDYVEYSRDYNDEEYELEFDKLKSLLPEDIDINWPQVRNEYLDYVEMEDNEVGADDKYEKFKEIILNIMKNTKNEF